MNIPRILVAAVIGVVFLTGCDSATAPDREPRAVVDVSCNALVCTIDASRSSSYYPIVNYRTEYGDGELSWGYKVAVHRYAAPGHYVISVVVIDEKGGVSEWGKTYTVGN